ncbi:PSD1 and planctomycete cytochrome C domain-containing protein [soil metagenome]
MPDCWTSIVAVIAMSTGVAKAVDFEKEIAPLLERRCLRCHLPGNAKGKVSLATAADLLTREHVVPGKPDDSTLLDLVTPDGDKKPQMPKEGKALTESEVKLLREWIKDGAKWPKTFVIKEKSKADKSWWSLQPLTKVSPPAPPGLPEAWAKNPIDRFVFAKLAGQGLTPSMPANPRHLIRRVTFDLTGLPPTAEAVEAFAADPSEDAYSKLIDKLLQSPAYGEQWGRHWLDVIRFGESNGFERNVIIPNAWPFRDYVINSFNDDKPFDRLVREHLAGDRLDPGNTAVEVGTGFLVAGPYDNVVNQDAVQAAVIRANTLDDIVRATGEAFLGMTVGCARCHHHKFDPISQQDYHRFAATFAGVYHGERLIGAEKLKKEQAALTARRKPLSDERKSLKAATGAKEKVRLEAINKEVAEIDRRLEAISKEALWIGQFRAAAGPFNVYAGGDPQKKGEAVALASPAFLSDVFKGYELADSATEAERRLAMAEWIVTPANPLTPRVLANRLWAWHFGTGIVETPSDFGSMGMPPSHPELLDWLAHRLHEEKWHLKPIHKQIVMSQTYRQASAYRADMAARDSGSRLLWRFPPRRLSGEEVRDSMLSVSGQLDPKRGGPGFRLFKYVQDNVATYIPLDTPGPETYRRAVYHHNARAARVDILTDFDCPDPAFAAPRRASTTTPLQALTLFNHQFTLDMALALAERSKADTLPGAIDRVYSLAYGRSPTASERSDAVTFVTSHGLRAYCRAILNSNEFLFVD